MKIQSEWLGCLSFEEALAGQLVRSEQARGGTTGFLLGLEHPTVITLGRRGDASQDLLSGFAGIPVVPTDRGGQATLHSPGQLVVYPILPLREWGLGPRAHVEILLEATAKLLRAHGISAEARFDNAGVYVGPAKIGFCGVRVDQGVSRHGLSLNVSNDLSLFRAIRPCGMAAPRLTSWENEVGSAPPLNTLFREWTRAWQTCFVDRGCSPKSGTVSFSDVSIA